MYAIEEPKVYYIHVWDSFIDGDYYRCCRYVVAYSVPIAKMSYIDFV